MQASKIFALIDLLMGDQGGQFKVAHSSNEYVGYRGPSGIGVVHKPSGIFHFIPQEAVGGVLRREKGYARYGVPFDVFSDLHYKLCDDDHGKPTSTKGELWELDVSGVKMPAVKGENAWYVMYGVNSNRRYALGDSYVKPIKKLWPADKDDNE